MLAVIVGWVAVATILIWQGVHILRNRRSKWFFGGRQARAGLPLGRGRTIAYALIHLVPGAAMLFALAAELSVPKTKTMLAVKLEENAGSLFFLLCLAAFGLWALVWPGNALRSTIREHPELADDNRAVLVERLIGGLLLCIVLFALAKL